MAAARTDAVLQIRNGFYYAAAFLGVFGIIGLRYLPEAMRAYLLPALILSNLMVGTFYFIAGLVLLERDEHTLEALAVSPLRAGEYLASKVITLTALSMLENAVIVLLAHGVEFDLLALTLGVAFGAAVYTLFGFVVVARYASINEFLLPSVAWGTPLFLPLLPYFGVLRGGWLEVFFWVQPLQPSLVLLSAAFRPAALTELLGAVVLGCLWVAVLWNRAQASYRKFVMRQEVIVG